MSCGPKTLTPPVREKKSSVWAVVGFDTPLGPTSSDSRFTGELIWKPFSVMVILATVPGRALTKMFDGFGLAGPMSLAATVPAGIVIAPVLQ